MKQHTCLLVTIENLMLLSSSLIFFPLSLSILVILFERIFFLLHRFFCVFVSSFLRYIFSFFLLNNACMLQKSHRFSPSLSLSLFLTRLLALLSIVQHHVIIRRVEDRRVHACCALTHGGTYCFGSRHRLIFNFFFLSLAYHSKKFNNKHGQLTKKIERIWKRRQKRKRRRWWWWCYCCCCCYYYSYSLIQLKKKRKWFVSISFSFLIQQCF